MTHLLAAMLLSAPAINVIELPDAEAKNIRLAVCVSAPYEMMDREQAAWRLLPRLLLQGTQEYSRDSIYAVSLNGNGMPIASGGPDIIRIEISSAVGNLEVAAGVIESILTKPRFREEDLASARRELASYQGDPVAELLDPARPSFDRATVDLCEDVWLQACVPSRISVVVGGKFQPGEATQAFEGRFKTDPPFPRAGTRYDKPPAELKFHQKPLTSFELASDPISFKDPTAGARLLAVHAFGAGKGSTLFRVLREREGLSYDQRAILWPTAKGWVPRLFLLRRAQEGDAAILERMLVLLEEDVAAWSEDDLKRAKALAMSSLNGVPVDNVFWLDETGPVANMAGDEIALRAFLAMAGAPDWNRERIKLEMAKVDLPALKAAADDIVKKAKSRVIPGLR